MSRSGRPKTVMILTQTNSDCLGWMLHPGFPTSDLYHILPTTHYDTDTIPTIPTSLSVNSLSQLAKIIFKTFLWLQAEFVVFVKGYNK